MDAAEGLGRQAGGLKLHLKRGVGLMAADLNGKSDPYVKVSAGGQTTRTRIMKATLNPEWDQTLSLYGELADFVRSGILLRVMDWDRIGYDDPLGEVCVPLQFLCSPDHHSRPREFAEPLTTKGIVHFRVTWEPAGELWRVPSSCESSRAAPLRAPLRKTPSQRTPVAKQPSVVEQCCGVRPVSGAESMDDDSTQLLIDGDAPIGGLSSEERAMLQQMRKTAAGVRQTEEEATSRGLQCNWLHGQLAAAEAHRGIDTAVSYTPRLSAGAV